MDFYKSYRACVRAKIAAIREMQLETSYRKPAKQLVGQYMNLADQYASRLGPPLLIVVRGLMGTGKSTLAKELAESLGAELLRTDVVRRILFPSHDPSTAYGQGRYSHIDRRLVDDVMKPHENDSSTVDPLTSDHPSEPDVDYSVS